MWFYRNEDWRTYARRYPLNTLILIANLAVFLAMTLAGGSTNPEVLVHFGAYYAPYISDGEWHRFITPIFLHIGWEHLLFNSFSLFVFAPGLEWLLGKVRYLLLYFLSGMTGFIATYLFSAETIIAAGASGAIFGVFGMFAFLSRYRRDLIDYSSRRTIIPLLIISVISTFIVPGISVTGHIGGLICGYFLGFFLLNLK